MTITGSGQISFDAIRIELGIPSQAPFSIEDAENGNVKGGYPLINKCSSPFPSADNPAQISEWYSYNHASALATLIVGGFDYSATSCTSACNLTLDCGTELYTKSSTVYTNTSCSAAPSVGYYALCSGGGHSNCYDVGSSGTINSITACGSTTTTTTTTTLGTGTCYQIINGNNQTRTVEWTDRTGTLRSGSAALNGEYYVCSTTLPVEKPSAAELSINDCTDGTSTPCTITCTSLACKQCSSNGVCTT